MASELDSSWADVSATGAFRSTSWAVAGCAQPGNETLAMKRMARIKRRIVHHLFREAARDLCSKAANEIDRVATYSDHARSASTPKLLAHPPVRLRSKDASSLF